MEEKKKRLMMMAGNSNRGKASPDATRVEDALGNFVLDNFLIS